jgi:hypothetical protein
VERVSAGNCSQAATTRALFPSLASWYRPIKEWLGVQGFLPPCAACCGASSCGCTAS